MAQVPNSLAVQASLFRRSQASEALRELLVTAGPGRFFKGNVCAEETAKRVCLRTSPVIVFPVLPIDVPECMRNRPGPQTDRDRPS